MSEEIQMSDAELGEIDLQYSTDDVRKATYRPMLSLGWKRFVVVDAERKNSKTTGHLMLQLQVAPLDGPGDDAEAHEPHAFNNIVLPFKNPKVPGHEPPNTSYPCRIFLRALTPEDFPPVPLRKGNGMWETHEGEILTDPEEVDRRKEQQTTLIFERLKEYWSNPTALVGETFYANVVQNGKYRNLDDVQAEPPGDAEVEFNPETFKDYVEG